MSGDHKIISDEFTELVYSITSLSICDVRLLVTVSNRLNARQSSSINSSNVNKILLGSPIEQYKSFAIRERIKIQVWKRYRITTQIIVCGGLGNFSQKKFRTEKIPRQIIFVSIKAFKRYVARFFKALSIMKVFSLTVYDSTQPNRKTIITTKVLSFL